MMQQRDVWSLSLGRWWNVQVRLHIFFVLFGIFTGYLAWQEQTRGNSEDSMPLALLCIGLLFVSVLIHELGHYFATQRLGGHIDLIVLGPIGGLRSLRIPGDPQGELLALLAGPLATLIVCLFSLTCAFIFQPEGYDSVSSLFNPFTSERTMGQPALLSQFFGLAAWINGFLFVLNLIPAFPFDGGRAMAALLRVMRPQLTAQRAVGLVATFARLVSIAIFIAAFIFRGPFSNPSMPPLWLALLLLSVFVFFSARVEEHQFDIEEEDEELFGYDFSQGYTSLERSHEPTVAQPGPISRWLARRKAKQEALRLQREADEDSQADEILARLHQVGMDGLLPREREILKRVSERLRTREND